MDQASNKSRFNGYAGRWVASIHGRIVGHGGTPQQATQAARKSRYKEIPEVTYVPTNPPLRFSSVLDLVRQIIPESVETYLVGGAVRDALLSRPIHDYDFLLRGDVFRFARKVADKIKGAYFPLDEETGVARIVYTDENGERNIMDFVLLKEISLEANLQDRDFTVNAMAVDLGAPHQLLDPLSGAADLWNKTLRACSPSAFKDDPIRILRAVRMAAGYGFHIHPETRKWMAEAVAFLGRVSPERLRDELFRILEGPKVQASIRALEMLGVLEPLLPELLRLKGLSQSAPHVKDAWEHTLDTLQNLDMLLEFFRPLNQKGPATNLTLSMCQLHLGKFRQPIKTHFQAYIVPDRSVRSLVFLAALYHDIGKPETTSVDDEGRIRFLRHETVGAEIAVQRGGELRLSKKEIHRLSLIIKNHMRPTLLAREQGMPSAKAIYRFFKDCGTAGIEICLISLADLLATYGNKLPQERWSRQLEVVRELMGAWWHDSTRKIDPPALISGNDVMEIFGLPPGPKIGELLEMVREAQVAGDLNHREEALSYLDGILRGYNGDYG